MFVGGYHDCTDRIKRTPFGSAIQAEDGDNTAAWHF